MRTSRLGLRRVAVGGDLEEIDLDRQVELAHEVGDEHERAAQQADDHQLVGAGEMLGDLARQRLDPRGDRLGRDHLVDDVGRLSLMAPAVRARGRSALCAGGILLALSRRPTIRDADRKRPMTDPCRDPRRCPTRAEQMYALIADVARYPEFLPWSAAARIRESRPRRTAPAR